MLNDQSIGPITHLNKRVAHTKRQRKEKLDEGRICWARGAPTKGTKLVPLIITTRQKK